MQELIKQSFTESIQTKIAAADMLSDNISTAAEKLVTCLLADKKIICCGDGFAHGIASTLVSSLLHRFEIPRPSLPAILLHSNNATMTSLVSYEESDNLYASQLRTIGQAGDVLVVFAADLNNPVILRTMEAAVAKDMVIIALTGGDGGEIAGLLGPQDLEIRIPSSQTIRILEVQQLIAHSLCYAIENTLFPGNL
ncbi:SIS domain-containing protein [Catenovulum sp. SM1970]|uniref:SIS domain-containing protein n=1 Tax=Marinifaba aquimaris TaxID=2741323 RepID=UPI001572C395|nr:SIS domain-containing protein [Marinifaba aquimaris]NTS76608.1 SIS domain-containing protein [Marinifaba aquimaris]